MPLNSREHNQDIKLNEKIKILIQFTFTSKYITVALTVKRTSIFYTIVRYKNCVAEFANFKHLGILCDVKKRLD